MGWSCHTPLCRFSGTQRLLAPRGIEEVDVDQTIQFSRQPRQFLDRARPLGRAELPVAVRQGRIVRVAGLVEEPDDLGLFHVLHAVHFEERGFAPVLLDLLGEPLELLVAVGRIRQ